MRDMRGSMGPAWNIFMHDLKIVFVIEFVGRKDAVILTLRSVLPLRRLQHRINVDDTLPRLR